MKMTKNFKKINKLNKSMNIPKLDKTKIQSIPPSVSLLTYLGLWIYLCYTSNLFLIYSLISLSVMVGLIFSRSAGQNGDLI